MSRTVTGGFQRILSRASAVSALTARVGWPLAADAASPSGGGSAVQQRVEDLEKEVAELKATIGALEAALAASTPR